ncbi:MAG: hypothetical protein ACXW1S_03150 [Acidimicrobiia bacterium]
MESAASRRRRFVAVLAAVLVFAFVVVACSSDDSTSSSSSTTGGSSEPSKLPSCPSASEVDSALKAGLDDPKDQINGSIRTCTYDTTAGGDEVVIRFETGVSATDFAAAAQSPGPSGETPSSVGGLGDAAYTMQRQEPGGTVTELAALSGTTEVSVLAPVPLGDVEVLVTSLLDSL